MAKKELKAKVKSLKAKLKAATPAVEVKVKKAKLVSPLAPAAFPCLPLIAGVEFAAVEAGIKYQNRKDVMLVRLAPGTVMAGVFTRSTTRSACVRDCQAKLALKVPADSGAAIVVNSGNSNAFTGRVGDEAVAAVTIGVADALGIPAARVFSSSTGVIGEPLPYAKITDKTAELVANLREDAVEMAAHAMMTTDTFPKGAAATVQGDGGLIQIAGIAKGSGMIAPDMATMLVYIFTDAKISATILQKLLSRNTDDTFNAITVDSDTSTSDTLLLAATGKSEAAELKGTYLKAFETALRGVMMDLAHQVIRDGEGATKFVEVRITGAATNADARKLAMAIANSPLVKTAIAGQDPNWGRIVAAIGKSGAEADRDKLNIRFGDIIVAENGWRNPDYKEEDGAAYMLQSDLVIAVDMGLGKSKRSVWTCDLTNRYIEINADYRS
ncbi:bifunctional glutamate N-acetyltransferase/amino-acid acetyltransferase ArgJ [Cypionkella sp.]|uniref:bifunctional glutamate N-acetyltransferase/amino-acid acetyltransferase ArgJ n=1 Tax=Cypionkella sp. TaxID=2811411 RepID=UPI002721BA03|nr:bifunctional glutamate N-acetyltransferase/amino-acid acetyltransferase ArgJ [Cypionkella sp.]MDO8982414.1 bifunctional glutamate N-acetyltransferase/amino-acid acetyltransferase ArgJ [Cypionkella sp.]MDP2050417.1 bifunctional glutamate N-acetyltransferase/amino-acid acetyltransferase ArgJ [Cypionkella sp.]